MGKTVNILGSAILTDHDNKDFTEISGPEHPSVYYRHNYSMPPVGFINKYSIDGNQASVDACLTCTDFGDKNSEIINAVLENPGEWALDAGGTYKNGKLHISEFSIVPIDSLPFPPEVTELLKIKIVDKIEYTPKVV